MILIQLNVIRPGMRMQVSVVAVHGGEAIRARVAVAGIHAIVEVTEGHVLRHIGGRGLVVVAGVSIGVRRARLRGPVLQALLVAALHELNDALRRLHVRYDRCLSLKITRDKLVNIKFYRTI